MPSSKTSGRLRGGGIRLQTLGSGKAGILHQQQAGIKGEHEETSFVVFLMKEDIIRQTSAVRLLFVESAILCEAGLDSLCDKIVVVEAPEEVRIERVIARDYKGDASPENINKVRARVGAQENAYASIPQQKRLTIINDGRTSIAHLVQSILTNS